MSSPSNFFMSAGPRAALLSLVLAGASVAVAADATAAAKPEPAKPIPMPRSKFKGGTFPDFGHMVPQATYAASYSDQPVFSLKADYPQGKAPPELPEFMKKIDFKKEPQRYLEEAQKYSFEGNLLGTGSKAKFDWDPWGNPVRPWYHIPWLHSSLGYPPNGGTEGFRGLIKEAQVQPYQLAASQAGGLYQVYAVTLVNESAGHTLGKMWKDPQNPDPSATDRRFGGGFPPGTVFAKLLFTDAPANWGEDASNPSDFVDYLQNGVDWKVYITQNWTSNTFQVKTVHLLQMDMMMRDPRADRSPTNPTGTGWVFGTFAYNGAVKAKNKFNNLVPLGIMWGNSPTITENNVNPYPPKPISKIINPYLTEQKIFDLPNLPPQHLGWNSRLNGPADLNTSSCMSCHNMGQYPSLNSLVTPGMVPPGGPIAPPQGGSPAWMKYFQNLECATPYNPEAYSTDMSMQVMISLQNFYNVKAAAIQGQWAVEFVGEQSPNVIRR